VSIAVIIPLFNHERFIADALRSVLSQSVVPERIIVIDDGSTDGSVEAARSVSDPRITLVSQPNAGAHAALNRGIALAVGAEFIGVLNSDDLYEADRIAECIEALRQNASIDVVATRLKIIDDAGRLLPADDARARWLQSVWQVRPQSLCTWLGIANFVKTTSNLFGRAEYFRANPFRPYRYVHDYYFAVTAALEGRLAVLDSELLQYRVHGSNTIKSGPTEKLPREVVRMNIDLLHAFAPKLTASPEIRARLAEYFRTLAENYADFRLEPFLYIAAAQFAQLSDADAEALCENLDAERFPELIDGKSRAMRERLAKGELDRALNELAQSKWLALGRLIGAGPKLQTDEPSAESRVKKLRKASEASAWYQLGRRLGFVRPADQ
jgi:glycosyltransferase involved in cell wall biosynthesis